MVARELRQDLETRFVILFSVPDLLDISQTSKNETQKMR